MPRPPYRFDLDPAAYRLPPGFLFGVCTSAYHSEGGYNVPGGPHNHWAGWEASGHTERSGEANRFWDDPEPYVEKAASLGLNAFRFGIEWARVQPSRSPEPLPPGAAPPPVDEGALDRYAEVVGLVYDAGMEPVVTLWHFTNPAWVGDDLWLRPEKVALFEDYVATMLTGVNRRLAEAGHPALRFLVTINEPFNAAAGPYLGRDHPPGRGDDLDSFGTMLVALLASHVRLYNRVHDLHARAGWRAPHVGFNSVTYAFYEIDKVVWDLVRSRERGVRRADVGPYLAERKRRFEAVYDRVAGHRLGPLQRVYWRQFRKGVAAKFAGLDFGPLFDALDAAPRDRAVDYVAVDAYDPFLLAEPVLDNPFRTHTPTEPKGRRPWWEWPFSPDVFRESVRTHADDAGGLPCYVLETNVVHRQERGGAAMPRPDGLTRSRFLRESLREVMRLGTEGVRVDGYFYWSLTDNYEWGSYALRMGLLEYDYDAHRILDADGLGDPTAATLRLLVGALQSGDPARVRYAFGASRQRDAELQAAP